MKRFLTSMIFLLATALAACSSAPQKADEEPTEGVQKARAFPGTAAWQHGALKLPEASPVVVKGRLDRLALGAGNLKEWLTADAAMFGERGEELVAQLDVWWGFAVGFFGGEPTDPSVWKRRGIDPERAFYAGFYPLGAEGEKFLASADQALRDSLGARKGETTLERMNETASLGPAAIPTGLNGELQRAVEKYAPLTGMRVVIPVAEASAFDSSFLSLIDALSMRQEANAPGLTTDAAEGSRVRVFTMAGDFPVVRLEIDPKHAIIDVVGAPADVSTAASRGGANGEQAVAALLRARYSFPSGRPSAPAPLDDPALSVSFHQPTVAALARLRGYQRTLVNSLRVSATERDSAVLDGVLRSEKLASNWHDEALGFRGLVYSLSLHSSESNRVGSLAMSFVGSTDKPKLSVAKPRAGLGVEERSVGVSLDFDPLFADEWRSWLELNDPTERLDLFGDARVDPLVYLTTMPRNLALIAANLAKGDSSGVAPAFSELLSSELPNVARAEVAAAAPDLTNLATAPRFISLFMLKEDASADDVFITASAARDFVIATTAGLVDVDVDLTTLPELTEGWNAIEIDGIPVHHVEWLPGDEPRLLVAAGLDEAESRFEASKLTETLPDVRDEVVFFHALPSAFVELLSSEESGLLKPIAGLDPPILAQRLGPVRGWVKPRDGEDARAIHFVFELQRPPKL